MNQHLGVFAKFWEPGCVKTRLAESIGSPQAANIYRAFVETTLARLATLRQRNVLAYTPTDRSSAEKFASLGGGVWELVPQCEGDLGQRMRDFFASQLEQGAHSIVILGTDSPNLPLAMVESAFQALESHEVVLGPTEDGGYYLIGISRTIPPLFDSMPWSKSNLWSTSIDRLERAGIRYATLDTWYDVDELTDLNRLRADLAADSTNDPALQSLSLALNEILIP